MLLAIDVGNTHTVLGLFGGEDGTELVEHWRIATEASRTADEIAVVLRSLLDQHPGPGGANIDRIALCSTVPSVLHEMRDMHRRYYGDVPAVVVEPGVRTGVPVLTDNPKEVGTDRVVNALAAVELFGGPCVIVDFGTATTFDAVSAKGEYLGGIICPGPTVSAEALFQRAAKLPRIDVRKPPRVIGTNTIAAMQSGLFWGYVDMVEGLLRRMKAELGGSATILATGGLAPVVAPESALIEHVDQDLTLHGLRLVWERQPQSSQRSET